MPYSSSLFMLLDDFFSSFFLHIICDPILLPVSPSSALYLSMSDMLSDSTNRWLRVVRDEAFWNNKSLSLFYYLVSWALLWTVYHEKGRTTLILSNGYLTCYCNSCSSIIWFIYIHSEYFVLHLVKTCTKIVTQLRLMFILLHRSYNFK